MSFNRQRPKLKNMYGGIIVTKKTINDDDDDDDYTNRVCRVQKKKKKKNAHAPKKIRLCTENKGGPHRHASFICLCSATTLMCVYR